jgi:hypothetical protein
MDQPGFGKYKNKTLMDIYQADPTSLNIDTWSEFYQLLNDAGAETRPGALPFRVWQGFNEMVEYLNSGDVIGYYGESLRLRLRLSRAIFAPSITTPSCARSTGPNLSIRPWR